MTSPRHDGKLSVHFIDLNNYYREWDLDQLPWDAVTPVGIGDEHPETLDEKLVEAISSRVLVDAVDAQSSTRPAATAFLYLYMTLAHGGERWVNGFPFEVGGLMTIKLQTVV